MRDERMRLLAKIPLAIITILLAGLAFGQSAEVTGFAPAPATSHNRAGNAAGVLTGSVHDTHNQPVQDARVEVRGLRDGQTVSAAYTTAEGQFEIDNLPVGTYEVVISHGLAQERQQVAIEGATAPVTFRLAEQEAGDAKAGNTTSVSVAEMKVPKKARQHYEKAAAAL